MNLIPRVEFFFQCFFRRQKYCPHCQSDCTETVAKKYGVIRIQRCRDCHLFFTSPIYQSSLTPHFYDTLYEGSGSVSKIPDLRRLEVLKQERFGSSDRNFSTQIEALTSICPNGSRRLLEIGSSWGYFLYQARQKGFDVTGIEIAAKRRTFGNRHMGVRIVRDFGELQGQLFDIVYASHVLEHFSNLTSVFKDIHLCLKPHGRLVIEVPHFDYAQFGDPIKKFIGAVHPLGFCSEFFTFNLPKYGFEVLGLFDDWKNFPARPNPLSSGEFLIVLAEKTSE